MTRRSPIQFACALCLTILLAGACGGREGSANAAGNSDVPADPWVDAQPIAMLEQISPAIPVYPALEYSADLTRQDNLNADRMYGSDSEVWTFVTPNSYPKVWHFYTSWLGMFRSYDAPDGIPQTSPSSRRHQINLNEAMQQPFVPGDEIEPGANRVILEMAESDTGMHTIVRYIITPTVGPAGGDSSLPAPAPAPAPAAQPSAPGD